MKFFSKKVKRSELREQWTRLSKQGALCVVKGIGGDEVTLSWFFGDKLDVPIVDVAKFNREIKNDFKSIKEDYNDLEGINTNIAFRFMQYVIQNYLNSNPEEIDYMNQSKNDTHSHFQMQTIIGDFYLYGLININEKHQVVAKYTNINVSNQETYETVATLQFKDSVAEKKENDLRKPLTDDEYELISQVRRQGFIYAKFMSKKEITVANSLVKKGVFYKGKPSEKNATIAYYSNI